MVVIDNLYPEKVTISEGATVSTMSIILAHDEARRYTGRGDEIVKETIIGEGAFIGVRAVVLPGVTIGRRAIVAAGAVVTRDVAEETVVGGVPARPLRNAERT